MWTPQGTDAARAQPLPLFCSKKKTTTSSTDHPDTVPVPRPKHTPRPTSRRVHRWSGFPSPPRAPPLGHRRTTPSQPPRPSHHPPEPPPPWRRGATNSRTAFAAARPSPTTNSTPPSVFTIPSRAPARRDCYPLNYKALILPTLLYGCESSFLREDLFKRLRSFHNRCARSICRVNQHHTFRHHTTSVSLFRHLGILDIDSYFHGHLR